MIGISLDIPEVACRGGVRFPSFLPIVSGATPTIFADFTSEGTTNHYWANGVLVANLAALITAISGTYTRASNATYFQGGILKTATSGVIRFPSDISSVAQGIRLTGAATNSVLQSNAFTTTWTLSSGAAPAQNVTGPDNTASSAWTITAAAGVGTALLQAVAIAAPSYFSVFAKAGTSNFVWIRTTDAGGAKTTWFNVSTGAVGTTNSTTAGAPTVTQSTPTVTTLANGWFLIGLQNTGAATTNITVGQSDADAGSAATTGHTSFIFGAQAAAGAFQSDYIPTTTGTVSQVADSLTFPFTQTTFSALAVVNNQLSNPSGDAVVLGCAPFDDAIHIHLISSVATTNGVSPLSGPAFGSPLAANKAMVAGSPAGRSVTCNGQVPTSDANKLLSGAPTSMELGSYNDGNSPICGNVNQFGIWNGLVASTAELQSITT